MILWWHGKKAIDKMKYEDEEILIIEYVALKSKMYFYIKEDGAGSKKAKRNCDSVVLEIYLDHKFQCPHRRVWTVNTK